MYRLISCKSTPVSSLYLAWPCQGCLQMWVFAGMDARMRKTQPKLPDPSCETHTHTDPRVTNHLEQNFLVLQVSDAAGSNIVPTTWRPSLSPVGPHSSSPWRPQVMRGINATLSLAAVARVHRGNCFHTAFTGESGRRSRKLQQGFMRWDSPFPPNLPLPPSLGGAEGCCGGVRRVLSYPSLAWG